ncbi:hypothetical protein [Dehalobacterium formicoaceticum]|uniref:Uncharacterized protein n=1 Tax=Dehalobacterium formicoaceticum TaxID=51515 RepID=A0ABT1Y3K2_9FIRM|nr:hypothetical protein [Dehalobacterium formicoaceticum]MCR6545451.1 hypothetical protein [Dehalobacterium formicoaceticum]
MVINTGTVLALRCPNCGKLSFHSISLFAFKEKQKLCFDCECEESTVTISTSKYRNFILKIECSMCESEHTYVLKYKELFSLDLFPLICLETGLEIGFIGTKDQVIAAVNNLERTFTDLEEEINWGVFSDNRDIMVQVLEYMNRLSEDGTLKCKCGNKNIDVDLLTDRLEMVCNDCGNRGVIFAENKEDLLKLRRLEKIELTEQEITIINVPQSIRHNGQQSKK